MKLMSILLLLLAASFFAESLVQARDIYISPDGTSDWNTDSCNSTAPCAVSSTPLSTSANEIINIHTKGGEYTETIQIIPTAFIVVNFVPWNETGDRVTLINTAFSPELGSSSATRLTFTNLDLVTFRLSLPDPITYENIIFENCSITGSSAIFPGYSTSVTFLGSALALESALSYLGSPSSPSSYIFRDSNISCADPSCLSLLSLTPIATTPSITVKLQNVLMNQNLFQTFLDCASLTTGPSITFEIAKSTLAFMNTPANEALFDSPAGRAVMNISGSTIQFLTASPASMRKLTSSENTGFFVSVSSLTGVYLNASTESSSIDLISAYFYNSAIDSVSNTVTPKIINSTFLSSTSSVNILNSAAYLERSSFLSNPGIQSSVQQLNLFGTQVSETPYGPTGTPNLTVHRLGVAGNVKLPLILTIVADPAPTPPIAAVIQAIEATSTAPLVFRNATGRDWTASATGAAHWVFDGPLLINQVAISDLDRFQVVRRSDATEITFSSVSSSAFVGTTPQVGVYWPTEVNFVPNGGTIFPIFRANFSLPMDFTQSDSLVRAGYNFKFTTTNQNKREALGTGLVNFQSASATPAVPTSPPPTSNGCGPEPLPKGLFDCQNGTWVSNSSIGSGNGTVVISTPVVIRGNLTVGSIEFLGLNTTIDVVGCASLPSQVTVTLTVAEYEALKRNGTRYADLIKSLCTESNGLSVNIEVNSASKKKCEKVKATLESNGQVMTGVFKIDSSQCNIWWIVLVSVLGGVVLIVIALVLIFTLVPAARECIRPYVKRKHTRTSIEN